MYEKTRQILKRLVDAMLPDAENEELTEILSFANRNSAILKIDAQARRRSKDKDLPKLTEFILTTSRASNLVLMSINQGLAIKIICLTNQDQEINDTVLEMINRFASDVEENTKQLQEVLVRLRVYWQALPDDLKKGSQG